MARAMKTTSHDERSIAASSLANRGDSSRLAAHSNNVEWSRLPRAGTRDPLCGLSRSTLNELILPSATNNGRPLVRSVVVKKRGAMRGIRLIHVPSLSSYLNSLAADGSVTGRSCDTEFVVEENGTSNAKGGVV